MRLIFVTGLAEVDRKTIVELALQRASRKGKFKVVDFDETGNLPEDIKITTDLDTARRVISKFYTSIEKVMISYLKEQKNDIIVNGYLTLGTVYGYIRAIPDEFFHSFKPDNIVILEKDSRETDQEADEHQKINRYYGVVYSSLCGSVLKIIKFREKKMMDAVKELSSLIRGQ